LSVDAGSRAASVAAELLAFYREPALLRPGYLHGATPMPDGPVVFRLALGRFPEGLEDLPAAEREQARVAAIAFVRQACLWERATHYQVLCLEPGAAAEEVKECYHLLIALIHPDRHAAQWPADGAQRANEAYAVLSDPPRRARYDEQLARAFSPAPPEGAPVAHGPAPRARRHRRGGSPAPVLARVAVVGGVVAALFIVQAWWVGGVSPQHSLLERAMPASGRWMREVLPDPPRFLGAVFDFGERLAPIEPPRKMAALGTWVPAPELRAVAAPGAAPAPAAGAAPAPAPAPATAIATPTAPAPAPAPAAVAVAAAEASPVPVRVAQAPVATPPRSPGNTAPGAPTREQVEDLVALLVSHYDAGDSEQIVNLFDRDRLGFWSRMNARNAYSDFFAATRGRRLRIDRLDWQASGPSAQARGEAIVVADYQDGRPRLERRVPVELDIVLNGSQPRIARLVLFPVAQ
jgi:hypothetical protein